MRQTVVLVLAAVLLASCGLWRGGERHSGKAYELTAADSDRVILESIREGWPQKTPEPLGGGQIGYQIRLWSEIDHDDLSAEAVPRGDDAYQFRVNVVGSSQAANNPAREKLVALIEKNAIRAAR
jgi:hypothetical protein